MARSMWKGTLTFGLVSVPVKLYTAVSERSVRFHQLHATDHARIVQKRFCAAEEEEVPFGEVVKGYEIAPGRHVVIEAEEFASLEPAFTRTIEIEDFVQMEEIDSILFDRPYYLVPNRGGARSYRLLLQAMRDTDKVAIGRVVLRSRQQLVAIHPRDDVLVMTTMNFGDEVVPTSELHELHEDKVELSDNELEDRPPAGRLDRPAVRPRQLSRYLPRGASRPDRSQGQRRAGGARTACARSTAGSSRPNERAGGQHRTGACPPLAGGGGARRQRRTSRQTRQGPSETQDKTAPAQHETASAQHQVATARLRI